MTQVRQRGDAERALHKALTHPLRHEILRICDERPTSPTELAEEIGDQPVAKNFFKQVTYHVDWLAKKQLLELVDTDNRRGGTQHFYKTIRRPLIDMEQAEKLSRPLRESQSASVLTKILEDLLRAAEAGTIDDHPQRSLLRMKIVVDEDGMMETAEATEAHLERLKDIAARSSERLAQTRKPSRSVATHTLVVLLPEPRRQSA